MIQRIMPKISTPVVNRSMLKNSSSKLKNLAGSSMQGGNPMHFEPVEMIIPGGLSYKEKAYFFIKGHMPKSVMERWVPNDGNHIAGDGDQLVTANMSGPYVNGILDNPHDFISGHDSDHSLIDDISNDTSHSFGLGDGDDSIL